MLRSRAALVAALVLAGSLARANGRFPAARLLTVDDGGRFALATTFGLVTSDDGGRSWRLTCEEALGLDPTLRWDLSLAASGAALVVGLPDGLTRGATAGCRFDRPASAPTDTVVDLASDGLRAIAAVSTLSGVNGVVLSEDGGESWRVGWTRAGFSAVTVDLAPGQPQRVYLSGQQDGGAPLLLRSDDGGQTFEATRASFPATIAAYLTGVDPLDRDRLYVRGDLRDGGTALLRSEDGGHTFVELTRSANPMTGAAFAPGGGTLWVGSPGAGASDGIFRSSDAGRSWQRVASGFTTLCLRHRDGVLYMCADGLRDPFALGCSTDGGESWNTLLAWSDLPGPDGCPQGSAGREPCRASWQALRPLLVPDGGASGGPRGCLPATAPPPDAGPDAPAAEAGVADAGSGVAQGGCSCRAAATSGPPGVGWAILLVVLLGRLCRRRQCAAISGPGTGVRSWGSRISTTKRPRACARSSCRARARPS